MMEDNGKGRIVWIDQARAIAMMMVIIGHTEMGNLAITVIYSFHLPLFFLISGMVQGLSSHLDEAFGGFFKRNCKRILLPYFAWSVALIPVHWFTRVYLGGSEHWSLVKLIKAILYSNPAFHNLSMPSGALWFLPVLFIVNILFWLCKKWANEDEKKFALLIFELFILGTMNLEANNEEIYEPWHLRTALVASFFYYIGYQLMKKKNGIRMWMNIHLNLRWKQVILALVMIVVGIGAGILNGKVSMHKNIYHSVVLFVSSSLLISFGVILFSMLLPQIAVLKNMGSQTMLCLALHIPMICLVQYYSSNSYSFYINHPFLLSICTIVLLMIICHIYSWLHFRILSKKISL